MHPRAVAVISTQWCLDAIRQNAAGFLIHTGCVIQLWCGATLLVRCVAKSTHNPRTDATREVDFTSAPEGASPGSFLYLPENSRQLQNNTTKPTKKPRQRKTQLARRLFVALASGGYGFTSCRSRLECHDVMSLGHDADVPLFSRFHGGCVTSDTSCVTCGTSCTASLCTSPGAASLARRQNTHRLGRI